MRNGALSHSPRFTLPRIGVAALALSLALSGCSSGGGPANNNNNGGGGGVNTIVLRGFVRDFTGANVTSAFIEIVGTTRSGFTSSTGAFSIDNVPAGALTFRVTRPGGTSYYNVVRYQGADYDTTQCLLPIPPLVVGNNDLPSEITMYGGPDPNNPPPPPPPPAGCP